MKTIIINGRTNRFKHFAGEESMRNQCDLLMFPLLMILGIMLAACNPISAPTPPTAAAAAQQDTAVPTPNVQNSRQDAASGPPTPEAGRPVITLPVAVYIVDGEAPADAMSSARTAEQLAEVYQAVNRIWAQAKIMIEVQSIQHIQLPTAVLQRILQGDFAPFFTGIDYEFSIPGTTLINAFYAREIGGANGIVPFRSRFFFVNDAPSVHDERVTSHEIGHILGLHHVLDDPGRLMFSGTNGMELTDEEIVVARYVAQGMLDRVR